MFERLNTPQEAYNFKLGSALKMEDTVVDILQASIDSAQDSSVKALFSDHLDQSPHQRENLEQVFAAFGWEVDDSPCPAIAAIEKEGKANAKKSDDVLVDSVLLQGAVETEHHEIGVYENLIINARAMGNDQAVALLEDNLRQEQDTLEKVKTAQANVAAVTPKQAA